MAKVWVAQDIFGWLTSYAPPMSMSARDWTELEVGEATLASWEHAKTAYRRMELEIQDMVNAKREAERSV